MTPDSTFWQWVEQNKNIDPSRLRLKYGSKTEPVDTALAILQIECRRRFDKKLADTLAADPEFLFPTLLSGEQSTSDRLAAYHKTLLREGDSIIDLTSGLGIDFFHCTAGCSRAVAVERDAAVAEALQYNAAHLPGADTAFELVCGDCRDFVAGYSGEPFDNAFIDPARRAADGGRIFDPTDCSPDVTAMLPALKRICRRLIVKLSPMLDIKRTLAMLPGCSRLIALGNTTECKELIAVIDSDNASDTTPVLSSVTLTPDGREVSFTFTAEAERDCETTACTDPHAGDLLFEPWPSMMKAGAFRLLARDFGLKRFHPNTQLFHASAAEAKNISEFPGDVFTIEEVLPYSSAVIKRFSRRWPAISVTARNFGQSAESLRSRLGVKENSALRLFALTATGDRRLLIVAKPMKK